MFNTANYLVKNMFLMMFIGMGACLSGCVTVSSDPKPRVDQQKLLESHIKLGMAYLGQKQRDSALRAFTRALEVDRRSAEAHQGMALVHQLNGELEMAEASFKTALKSRADFSLSDIQFTYGRFLMEEERFEEAFGYFEEAGRDLTYRNRANALFFVGRCAEKLGNEKRAMAAYQHALNLNERFAPAALELAHKTFDRGEYADAKKYLDMFVKNSRQSARSLWLGIRIERIFGNRDKEASYALALRNLHPYSREYLEYKELLQSEK